MGCRLDSPTCSRTLEDSPTCSSLEQVGPEKPSAPQKSQNGTGTKLTSY